MQSLWLVYIVRCDDDTLYTGITIDIDKRLTEHNSSDVGAKYTKGRRPVALVYSEPAGSRSEAASRENQIKKMSRSAKLALIAGRK
ncbi:MAG: GIY-YIG nuclease family protein [Proteobacteria bacterium]|nr:GIY-YIG nuclease family protein [Pseudomonadota bacterium]MBU1736784.1 GIY-YIG nuclease family protein [Pseudomonadota bacterium]